MIGRRSRIAKVFGLRIDLDHVERVLAGRGVVAAAADGGDHLILAVCDGARPVPVADVQELARLEFHLPAAGVHVSTWAEIPRLPSGKTDYRRLAEADVAVPSDTGSTVDLPSLQQLYADLLGRRDVRPTDSFISLGGEAPLSYVEVSLRLERMLGQLPARWPALPLTALLDASAAPRRWGREVETNVLLRAVAIVTIVATHAGLFTLIGGAHVLLGLLGYNFARFQLPAARGDRLRGTVRAATRIAVPSMICIAVTSLLMPGLGWRQVLLVNSLQHEMWEWPAWHYWFIEATVQTLALVALVLAVPAISRLERRHPFGLAVGLVVVGLLARLPAVGLRDAGDLYRVPGIFWLFALGWATAKARTQRDRIVVSGLLLISVPGFTGDPVRDGYILAGLLAVVWVPQVRVPSALAVVAGTLASASLWIYLVHWPLFHHFDRWPLLSTGVCLAAGVVVQVAVARGSSLAATTRWRRATASTATRSSRAPRKAFPITCSPADHSTSRSSWFGGHQIIPEA